MVNLSHAIVIVGLVAVCVVSLALVARRVIDARRARQGFEVLVGVYNAIPIDERRRVSGLDFYTDAKLAVIHAGLGGVTVAWFRVHDDIGAAEAARLEVESKWVTP